MKKPTGGGSVLAVPLFKKHRELPAQLNKQVLCAGGALHHQCKVLLLHVIKVRVVPCVHGDLLPAEQHQQLPLLFGGLKIALRAVPVCVPAILDGKAGALSLYTENGWQGTVLCTELPGAEDDGAAAALKRCWQAAKPDAALPAGSRLELVCWDPAQNRKQQLAAEE